MAECSEPLQGIAVDDIGRLKTSSLHEACPIVDSNYDPLAARQQTELARFGELALWSDDLDGLLAEACRSVAEQLGAEFASVMQTRQHATTLFMRAGVGWRAGTVGRVTLAAAAGTFAEYALDTRQPVMTAGMAAETRFACPPLLAEHGVEAIASVPILGERNRPLFGLLQVGSRTPRPFGEADILLLRHYANHIAAAVGRVRAGVVADLTARKLAETDLRQSNEALKAEVVERTRELVEADEKRELVAEALRQSSKMEAVGQLTGGLAHDFNNMLAGISGNLELMRSRAAQGRTTGLERYIDAALLSSQRAAALTNRLLAFSRRQTLDPKATNLNELVSGMEELHRRTLGPSVEIETRLADGLWLTLCDPHQLENALLNLVINARDAMPDGGHLLIRTANTVPLGLAETQAGQPSGPVPAGEYVTLTVTDTGVGMEPEVLDCAFDPFFTTKPPGQGTGLGLSMIQGFVAQLGGQVHLRSEAGQGTTVTLYLPRHLGAAEAEREMVAMPNLRATGAGGVVLLVEDEAAIRTIVAEVLSDLGFRVLQAADSRSGLDVLESAAHIDLLVTDVGLPGGLNGRQLASAARHRRPGLKVLFITGYGDGSAPGSLLQDAGTQVMAKPFGVNALAAMVQGIISH